MKTLESTEALVGELRKVGLRAEEYRRGPLGKRSFVANLNPSNTLRFWKGDAKVQIDTDTKLRQAAIVAVEDARTIVQNYDVSLSTANLDADALDKAIKRRARERFPVAARGLRITKVEITRRPSDKTTDYGYASNWKQYGVRVTARIPKQENFFLVGYDETSQFISVLPEKPTSVKRAHEILRPAGVPKSAVRQGEWFFVPATKAVVKQIEDLLITRPGSASKFNWSLDRNTNDTGWFREDRWSSHRATETVFLGRDRYVRGVVFDRRKNRHGAVLLRDWHRVVRNNEVVAPDNGVSTRYWD